MRDIGSLEQFRNFRLFIQHVGNPRTLRAIYEQRGQGFSLFGGTAVCKHADVKALMAQEPEKVPWFYGPMQDRTDYFTANYMPFLQKGDNHASRRAYIQERIIVARHNLGELDALLATDSNVDRALSRFLFKHLASVELSDEEWDRLADYRKFAAPLSLLPTWLRRSVLGRHDRRVRATRAYFLQKFETAGVKCADSLFDVLWFNTGTLGFYPQKAMEALADHADLRPRIAAEAGLAPSDRVSTIALVHEMLRIHSKIASVNYKVGDEVKIAVIATATVDPERYENPMAVDLNRDVSDALSFAGPSPNRSCPGDKLAPEMMACVIARLVQTTP